jgi:hypothetical protein
VTAGGLEQAVERVVVDPLAGGLEAVADEAGELRRGDRPELELFALRQKGSSSSPKIRSRMWRRLPR